MGSQSRDEDFERRRSFRCRVPDRQQGATLEAGLRRVQVRLVNESAEGVAVRADGDPALTPGDIVRLSTTFGRFEARVVYATPIEAAEARANQGGPRFRLGLEWLQELPTPPGAPVLPPTA